MDAQPSRMSFITSGGTGGVLSIRSISPFVLDKLPSAGGTSSVKSSLGILADLPEQTRRTLSKMPAHPAVPNLRTMCFPVSQPTFFQKHMMTDFVLCQNVSSWRQRLCLSLWPQKIKALGH